MEWLVLLKMGLIFNWDKDLINWRIFSDNIFCQNYNVNVKKVVHEKTISDKLKAILF